MLAPTLIWIACHLFLVICLAISWQLLETENGRQNRNNHHLRDFQPDFDDEGRPYFKISSKDGFWHQEAAHRRTT